MSDKPLAVDAWMAQLGMPGADRDYQPGHARIQALLQHTRSCRPRLRIRIAGTNGKGSTAFMLAQALMDAGCSVGLYTSPHIRRFHERIRLQGEPVADSLLRQTLARLMPQALQLKASYFETATAMALDIFGAQQVDVEILEAGVGARFDATTAVAADMALLTPIGLDHQLWLGDTLTAIATEKACAMQGCSMVLSASQVDEVADVLRQIRPDLHFVSRGDWPRLQAWGIHQQGNASLVLAALQMLAGQGHISPAEASWRHSIEHTQIPGRMQCIRRGEWEVWLDAAHNRHAIEALQPSLQAMHWDAILVLTREDRSLDDAVGLLRPLTDRLVGSPDGVDQQYATPEQALYAELKPGRAQRMLVLGSFTTVAAALQWLEKA